MAAWTELAHRRSIGVQASDWGWHAWRTLAVWRTGQVPWRGLGNALPGGLHGARVSQVRPRRGRCCRRSVVPRAPSLRRSFRGLHYRGLLGTDGRGASPARGDVSIIRFNTDAFSSIEYLKISRHIAPPALTQSTG